MAKTATTKNPEKYEYAEMLYLKGVPQKMICEKVGVTPNTITKWKNQGAWEVKRAAHAVSIDSLINKLLRKASTQLDDENSSADDISKIISQLKNFNGRVTPDEKVVTLIEFGDWAITQVGLDPEVTDKLIKELTKLQDRYILQVVKRSNG